MQSEAPKAGQPFQLDGGLPVVLGSLELDYIRYSYSNAFNQQRMIMIREFQDVVQSMRWLV
jgi:hypothetical protein